MTLNDREIEALALAGGLTPFDRDEITGSGYLLHASRAFWPATGEERYIDRPSGVVWRIEPGETIVVKTRERVRMPADLAGLLTPLRRLAESGIALLDGGVIEPLYDGPIGVTLVNLSQATVLISPLDAVARLSFQRLSGPGSWAREVVVDDDTFDTRLAKSAARRPATLAGLAGAASAVPNRRERVARFAVPAAVALVLALAAEPFVARAVTQQSPYASNGDVQSLRDDLGSLKGQLAQQRGEIGALRARLRYDDGVIARLQHRRR